MAVAFSATGSKGHPDVIRVRTLLSTVVTSTPETHIRSPFPTAAPGSLMREVTGSGGETILLGGFFQPVPHRGSPTRIRRG